MRNLILLVFLFSNLLVTGQEQVGRFEIEKKVTENDFNVLSAEEEGLVVFRETDKYEKGDKKWEFRFLNTNLEETLNFDMFLENEYNLIGYDFDKGFFYMLFKDGVMNDSDWYLIKTNFNTGDFNGYLIRNELQLELSHFLVTGNYMVMGGRVENKPTIVHYSMMEEQVSVLPGFYRKESELVDMKRNVNGTFNVLFLDKEIGTEVNILYLKVYSDNGEMLLESSTRFENDMRVHSGTISELEGSDLVVVGTYGHKKSKLSQGFYFINVRPGDENKPRLTDFTELDNFFKYLGENREQRIKEKIEEARKEKPFEYRATVMVWQVREEDGKYYLFAELVDPQYQTNSRRRVSPYTYPGSPFWDNYYYYNNFNRRYFSNATSLVNKDVMVSVEYKQNIMVAFDAAGNKLFDASQVIDDVETPMLDQVSAYNFKNGRFQLVYKQEDELYYTQGTEDGNILADSLVNIVTPDPMDDIRNDDQRDGGVIHWYDDFYFVWGYQRIKHLSENERRTVFYVNKIKM